MREQDL